MGGFTVSFCTSTLYVCFMYIFLKVRDKHTERVCHGYFNSADRKDTETVGGQMSVAEFDSILYIQTDEYTSGPEACVEIVLDKEEYPVEL